MIYDAAHLCYDFFGDYQQRKTTADIEEDSLSKSQELKPELKKRKKSAN